jgi:uncharacterized Zn-finger protein
LRKSREREEKRKDRQTTEEKKIRERQTKEEKKMKPLEEDLDYSNSHGPEADSDSDSDNDSDSGNDVYSDGETFNNESPSSLSPSLSPSLSHKKCSTIPSEIDQDTPLTFSQLQEQTQTQEQEQEQPQEHLQEQTHFKTADEWMNQQPLKRDPTTNSLLCPIPGCPNSYKRPSKLKQHITTHTGEKPFDCTFPGCGKKYRRRDHRDAHVLTHSVDPAERKPFGCEYCSVSFTYAHHLKRHLKTHETPKPYKVSYMLLYFMLKPSFFFFHLLINIVG